MTYRKEYYAQNKEKMNAASRAYYAANKERMQEYARAKRASGTITHKNRLGKLLISDCRKAVPCADCRGSFATQAMDFDHLPGQTKSKNVSLLVSGFSTVTALLVEINKCEVICANCHRLRTFERRS